MQHFLRLQEAAEKRKDVEADADSQQAAHAAEQGATLAVQKQELHHRLRMTQDEAAQASNATSEVYKPVQRDY